ncbi:MAG TPA: molybdenum cofactor guanylyltransferase [Ilumatobacteraceae bacterium]|jgi:molybdopterin-guanine dinucleotide biosynthesis protein A
MDLVLGAVLCGGSSTRMGSDKATLPVDGVPMARRVADSLLAAGCAPIVAVGGDADRLASLELDHLGDQFPGEGPLGGVLTVLSVVGRALIVSCDIPHVRSASLLRLVEASAGHQAAIACTDHVEPLCALWTTSALPVLRSRFMAGERAMHRAIEGLDVAWVAMTPEELRNVNTPDDLHSL